MAFVIDSIDHVVVGVSDAEVSARWYERVLGVAPHAPEPGWIATTFSFGRQMLRLRPVSASKAQWFTAHHQTAGSHDLCFLTTSTPDEIVEHLKACGVPIEVGPVERQGAQGRMTSIYCRDPDGSLIEIATQRRSSHLGA
jgi:catechol 2,3-dioxygenase-like lactoylglutathione lyase family enzyme